jgi:hypothetical protein
VRGVQREREQEGDPHRRAIGRSSDRLAIREGVVMKPATLTHGTLTSWRHFMSGTPKLIRAEFTRGAHRYVAVRYLLGRVELYRVVDGIETFVRYASRDRSMIDCVAVDAVSDRLDQDVITLSRILAGGASVYEYDVRIQDHGEWLTVSWTYVHPSTARKVHASCSVRASQEVRP